MTREELKEKIVNVLNDYIKEIADGRYGIGAYDIVQDKNDADALKDVMEDMRQHGDY